MFQLCAMYYFGIMRILFPVVEHEMLFPVAVYGIIISVMVHCAASRSLSCQDVNFQSRISCVVGAILFAISDSILAINKFYAPVNNAKFCIMLTYYLAQFLIAVSTY